MNVTHVFTIPGAWAHAELVRRRGLYPTTGLYPVCLGDVANGEDLSDAECEDFAASLPSAAEVETTIAESLEIDAAQWFAHRVSSNPHLYHSEEGEWPASVAEEDRLGTVEEELSGEPGKEVLIGLFPVSAPWEVFAYLGWGGWNDCPSPEEHCAVHRYWEALYGAEIDIITDDVIWCSVARPPGSREESLRLAYEQYAYCPDNVDQGWSFVAALAAELLDARDWHFWWD